MSYYQLACRTCVLICKPVLADSPDELLNPSSLECSTLLYDGLKAFHAAHEGHELETFEVMADGPLPPFYAVNPANSYQMNNGPQPATLPIMFRTPLSAYQLENLYPETNFTKPTPQDAPGYRAGTITTPFGVTLQFTYDGAAATFNVVENPATLTEVAIKSQIDHDAAMFSVAKKLAPETPTRSFVPRNSPDR